MENNSSEMLHEEQQKNAQDQIQQDAGAEQENPNSSEDQAPMEEGEKGTAFGSALRKFSGATLGIVSALFSIGGVISVLWGIVLLCETGYDRWFGELYGEKIGNEGLVYVFCENAIMKQRPNKKILTGISDLEEINNQTGIVCQNGKKGIIDLNTAKFLLPARYNDIWTTTRDTVMAATDDTVYTIALSGWTVVKHEPTASFYRAIRAIYEDDYYDRYGAELLIYEYTDYTGRCGLMSKEFKKLTPAIYTTIDALSGRNDVFLCRFDECNKDEEYDVNNCIGELRNNKGEKIEYVQHL